MGESFRYIFPRLVKPSYQIATAYCFCDVIDKSHKTLKTGAEYSQVAINAFDCMIWQILASVAIPGFVINRTVEGSTWILERIKNPRVTPLVVRWLPVVIGISTIPFIVHPIDNGTTWLLNKTSRQFYT